MSAQFHARPPGFDSEMPHTLNDEFGFITLGYDRFVAIVDVRVRPNTSDNWSTLWIAMWWARLEAAP